MNRPRSSTNHTQDKTTSTLLRHGSHDLADPDDQQSLFHNHDKSEAHMTAIQSDDVYQMPWYALHSQVDFVVAGYLAMSMWPYFQYPTAHPWWMMFHVSYLVFLVLAPLFIFKNRQCGVYVHWMMPIVMDYHPLLFFSLCYTELGGVIPLVDANFRDYLIQEYEERLFGCQMSQELHKMVPYKWVGEYLCFCYVGYFIFIGALLLIIGLRRPRQTLHIVTCTVSFVFVVNFVVFTYFPVEGPYWQLNRVEPDKIGYSICRLVHSVLNGGSAHGTAFPSSHVSIAITVWACAIRYHSNLAIFYCFVIPGLCIATVYGGFHYGVDALWGLIFGLVFSTMGNSLAYALLPITCCGNTNKGLYK